MCLLAIMSFLALQEGEPPASGGKIRGKPPAQSDVDALRKELEEVRKEVERLKQPADRVGPDLSLQKPSKPGQTPEEKKKLEEEFRKALGGEAPGPVGAASQAQTQPVPGLRLIDIALDLLAAAGGSSVQEAELRDLEAGGHDPKNRGFTIQNVELTFSGIVDPYFRGDANIVLQIDENGDSTVELEEVYLTTLDLPYNLQLKAGQFFNGFGRMNPIHPHAWEFVDQPVVNSRFMGPDGLRNPGTQLSWLTPLPFFAEVIGSVQNAQGETAPSFRGAAGETVAGRPLVDPGVRSLADMLYLVRLRTSFDPSDELTIVPGASALFGPNATGSDTRTQVYGADLYAKWKPLTNDKGFPFLSWQTEVMVRRYEAGPVFDAGTEVEGREVLGDWGFYSQAVWGFERPWSLGLRYDHARGEEVSFSSPGVSYASSADSFQDRRSRGSAALTYYPSEFSKIRLQYSYDRAQFLIEEDAHSIYLQVEIMFGAHGAHKF